MRKIVLILPLILLALLAPRAYAWKWTTHRAVAKAAYDQLPENVRSVLNYSLIVENGSVWPDQYRYDPDPYNRTFPDHFHPQSRNQATYWIAEAKNRYENGDYDNASLYLGIASHYIADSTALVHCGVTWDWNLHSEFEQQGASVSPATPSGIIGFDLTQKLTEFYNAASTKWQQWLGSRDQSVLQEGVDAAASYIYNAWCQALGVTPHYAQETGLSIDFRLIAAIVLVVLVIAIAVGMKRYYREEF